MYIQFIVSCICSGLIKRSLLLEFVAFMCIYDVFVVSGGIASGSHAISIFNRIYI